MKIVVVTAEPKANYHFHYLNEEQAKDLVHLVPDTDDIKGKSFVPVVTGLEQLDDANLLVIEGGDITEWTKMVGFEANDRGIPVVLSEMAYNSSEPAGFEIPFLVGISATSPYGSFNYHSYLNDDMVDVVVTGHPMLDNLPEWTPEFNRVLVLSSESIADHGSSLKASVRSLETAGYNVEVRPHPREAEGFWDGFKLTDELNLIKDLAKSSIVIGVPGTGFTAAVALGIPTIAIAETAGKKVLPEYKYIFPYISSKEIAEKIGSVESMNAKTSNFITGPVGGSGNRMLSFWISSALTDEELETISSLT